MEENNVRLYLQNWPYNAALILDDLENLVISNGGKIASTWDKTSRKRYLITNRTLSAAVRKQEDLVSSLRRLERPTLCEQEAKLTAMKSIQNDPVASRHGDYLYITFFLGGFYYSYNMCDNPFFEFTFSKIPVVDGHINPDCYSVNDKKSWFTDDFYRFDCTTEDRAKAAAYILDMLISANASKRYRGSRKPQKLYFIDAEA